MLEQHIEYGETMRARVQADMESAATNPDWAYPQAVLRWRTRYHEAEQGFAQELPSDIDELAGRSADAGKPERNQSSARHQDPLTDRRGSGFPQS
jgi:hypothetical protein